MSPANRARYAQQPGHVESWFIRANDPNAPRAVWLKETILAPLDGPPVAEAWFIWFDGTKNQTVARKVTVPVAEASFSPCVEVAGCRMELGELGGGASGTARDVSWKLTWPTAVGAVSAPLSLFPLSAMFSAPFPKSKLLTPFPALAVSGQLKVPGETVQLDGWLGMQGHNWGKEHAFEYAWGACVFPRSADGPEAVVEGYSARVQVFGRALPRMSALVVRRGDDELRFDRTFDFFRQEAAVGPRRWTVRLKGSGGEARLRMDAGDRPIVCLGYQNPNGQMSYCFNSKLADVLLEVEPRRGPAFRCKSAHGGALELLRREPEAGLEVV